MAAAVLMAAACQEGLDQISTEEGMGYVTLNITPSEHTRATSFAPEELRVRIYDKDDRLVRLYTESDDIPEKIALVAGSYKFKVEARDKKHTTAFKGSDVTDDREKIYYIGEKPVTVKAGEPVEAEIKCNPQHVRVGVTLSEDDGENELLSEVKIALAPMLIDSSGKATDKKKKADFDKAYKDGIDKLEFDVAKVAEEDLDDYAYFLLPEDEDGDPTVETIAWVITAKHTAAAENEGGDPVVTSIDKAGQIVVDKGKAYELQFRYSQLSDGSITVTVNVDYSVEGEDHTVTFKPEPEIKPTGENTWTEGGDANANVFVVGTDKSFTIESINPITALKVNDVEIWPNVAADAGVNANMFVVTPSEGNKKFDVTVKSAYFATLAGGEQDFSLSTYDGETKVGEFDTKFLNQGLTAPDDVDLWLNTAKFNAVVTDAAAKKVSVKFRRVKGATEYGEWVTVLLSSVTNSDHTFAGKSVADWTEGTNANKIKIYTPNSDKSIFANATYEYQLVIDGSDYGPAGTLTTSVTQPIQDAGFESSSLSCWTQNNTNPQFWGSGNNTYKKGLCTQGSMSGNGGSYAAKLASSETWGVLASGNLFTGTFTMNGMAGTVGFGQPYTWTARPTAMRVKLHATVGKADIAKYKDETDNLPLNIDDQDIARIYALIVDWSARPGVTSGTSAPTGCFEPTAVTSLIGSGAIIGYATLDIDKSTEGDAMVTVDIPFEYYDKETQPKVLGNTKYTIVISAACSKYGDYMCGCSSNVLYVDDFEWVY